MPPAPAATRPEDRVPVKQKICYGLGKTTELYAVWLFKDVATPILNVGYGLSNIWIGWAFFIFRIWDAVTDPVMGWISDNVSTRWGRRRPFIVLGALLTGAIFPLAWFAPADWSPNAVFAYFIACGVVLYTAFTIWAMPYQSLGLEMTPDYHERTSVNSYLAATSKITSITMFWALPFVIWLGVHLADVAATAPDGEKLAAGMRILAVPLGAAIAIFGMLPGLFVQERYFQKVAATQKEKVPFWLGLRQTLQNRPFRIIIGVAICFSLGGMMVGSMGRYVATYYVFNGDWAGGTKLHAYSQTIGFVTSLAAIPAFNWLARRYGKVRALQVSLITSAIGYLSTYWLYNAQYPYLMLLAGAFIAPALSGLWMIVPSLNADIVDDDELRHGRRREGSYASIFSWLIKAGQSAAILLSGYVMVWTGFDQALGRIQTPDTLANMRVCFATLPAAFYLIALVLLAYYPLTAARSAEIRQALETRRGKV
jgi:glycoside/pentoside/hexuronide:cation symporter, GPH family